MLLCLFRNTLESFNLVRKKNKQAKAGTPTQGTYLIQKYTQTQTHTHIHTLNKVINDTHQWSETLQ